MSRSSRWGLFVFSIIMLAFATVLFMSFAASQTAWFEWFSLPDPSKADEVLLGPGRWERVPGAGWYCGLIISGILLGAMTVAFRLFINVLHGEDGVVDRVRDVWKGRRDEVRGRTVDHARLFEALCGAAPPTSRVRAALDVWRDDDVDASAELMIEARAAETRQMLALLSTVANVLVLVGLVGNFFGLADTVRQLPGLHRSQMAGVESASSPGSAAPVTESRPVVINGITVTESTTRAPRPAQSSSLARKRSELQADGHLNKIAAALGVVVCSSVMGILSMALLSFYVSLLRTRLTAVVEAETAFLEAEVAPLLRRRADPADVFSEAMKALAKLPLGVSEFARMADVLAKTVEKSGDESRKTLARFESLFQSSQGAYQSYEQAVREFLVQLAADRGAQIQLADATAKAQNDMADSVNLSQATLTQISQQVASVITQSKSVHGAYELAHRKYLEKMEQFETSMFELGRANRDQGAQTSQAMVDAVREETRASADASRASADAARAAVQTVQAQFTDVYDRVKTSFHVAIDDLLELTKTDRVRLDKAHQTMMSELVEKNRDEMRAMQARSQAWVKDLDNVLGEMRKEQQHFGKLGGDVAAALAQAQQKTVELTDRAAKSFEVMAEGLLTESQDGARKLIAESQDGARKLIAESQQGGRRLLDEQMKVVDELHRRGTRQATDLDASVTRLEAIQTRLDQSLAATIPAALRETREAVVNAVGETTKGVVGVRGSVDELKTAVDSLRKVGGPGFLTRWFRA